jgi:hypothetical protein
MIADRVSIADWGIGEYSEIEDWPGRLGADQSSIIEYSSIPQSAILPQSSIINQRIITA